MIHQPPTTNVGQGKEIDVERVSDVQDINITGEVIRMHVNNFTIQLPVQELERILNDYVNVIKVNSFSAPV